MAKRIDRHKAIGEFLPQLHQIGKAAEKAVSILPQSGKILCVFLQDYIDQDRVQIIRKATSGMRRRNPIVRIRAAQRVKPLERIFTRIFSGTDILRQSRFR